MTGPQGSPTADELLERREVLEEQGRTVTLDELCRGASPDVRSEVERRLGYVLAAELALEPTCPRPEARAADVPFVPAGKAGRYVAPAIRAEGGMGVLCVADDVELGRRVAYKVMKPGQAKQAEAVERFYNEAEITARLAHPGIVPVFGRVTDDTGLPAYASEYVSGQTLAAVIEQYRALGLAERSARRHARVRLLRAFVATCQVVAYAHSRGVIHGDIKPLNILIDEFGATRLIDWGVARSVSAGLGPSDDRAAVEEAEGPAPRAGTLYFMSTPYGSPTFASDVYALGLTLALALADGDLRRDHLRPAPDTPAALWAVACKAMSAERGRRYASADELGREVQDVLDDRPVSAYLDPLPTRLRRVAARHRQVVASAVVLLVVAAVAGPIVGTRERRLRNHADAERLRVIGLTTEVINQAELVGKFQATLPGSRALLGRTLGLIEQLARDGEAGAADPGAVAANFYRAGRIYQDLNELAGAEECYDRSTRLAERRAAAAPGDASNRLLWANGLRDRGVVLVALGRAGEAAASWDRARVAVEPIAADSPEGRWTLARVETALGNLRMLSGDQPAARAAFGRALALAEGLVAEAPADTRFLKALADLHSNQGLSYQMEAMPRGFRVVAPARLADAAASYRKALDLRRQLSRLEPGKPETLADVAASLNHLANASQAAGGPGLAAAESLYRECRAILEALVFAYPGVPGNRRDLAEVYSNLNVLLVRQQRRQEAAALSRSSVEIFERLVADYPDTPDLFTDLGTAQAQAAVTLRRLGETADADARLYASAAAYARAHDLTREEKRHAELARKALSLLKTLRDFGYFRDPGHAAALRQEPAFALIRDDPDFPGRGTDNN